MVAEDVIRFGRYALKARETPGHTSGCVTYVTLDLQMAFTGDALLIRSCGRTDFQEGSAHTLRQSMMQQQFTLPDDCAVLPRHDYKGRTASTISREKRFNPRLGTGKTEAVFVAIISELKLAHPRRMDVAVPANLQCGNLKPPAVDGTGLPPVR